MTQTSVREYTNVMVVLQKLSCIFQGKQLAGGLSRLCSTTATDVWRLEQLFVVLSNPFKSSFLSAHIKHEKVNDFIENYELCDFLEH